MAAVSSDPKVISLPFAFANGRVSSIYEYEDKTWRDRVYTVLTTNAYERVWYKYFGASLQSFLFDGEDTAAAEIFKAVSESFSRWLPDLTVVNVTTNYDRSSGELAVHIIYKLPSGTEDSVKITTSELSQSGEVKVIYNGR